MACTEQDCTVPSYASRCRFATKYTELNMAIGRFLLCLHSHMPYVLSHGKSPHGTDWLDESAAECYLPLLHALDRLLAQGIKPRWTVNMTPVLAEQLVDEGFKAGFEEYCQAKIDAADEDIRRFDPSADLDLIGLAGMWKRHFGQALDEFQNRWGRDIISGFRYFQEQGSIEVVTCGATHGYLPLLGTDEAVRAQVKLGVDTYKKHFGKQPRGIWLPECAYRPAYTWRAPVGEEPSWPRVAVEEVLQENGIEYFFVDSHMIRGGEPLGTYAGKFPQLAEMFARSSRFFSPPEEFRSEYEHYALPNGVVCMARDPQTTVKVWSGDHGYPGDPYYLEFHKQLYPGRHRYWRISEDKRDLGKKQPYDPWTAYEHICDHADDMVTTLKGTLAHYRGMSDRTGTIVAMYDTELFGHWWWEGPEFLYQLGVRLAADPDIECVSGGDLIDEEPPRHMITLPEGSWGEGGYHFVWLNQDNLWTWEKLYPAQRELRRLCQTVFKANHEYVEQAAREILLAEASDWQFLISTQSARDYAEIRFEDHILRFHRLAHIAQGILDGKAPTGEDEEFLKDCQQKDAPFPNLDLTMWAGSGSPTVSV